MAEDQPCATSPSLGADLEYLIAQLGGEIESTHELTRLVSARRCKASFKLILRDGRIFKARRFMNADRFSSALALAPLLENLPFARCIASRGMATVEQWIEGTALDARCMTADLARQAGDLLGRVHTIADLPGASLVQLPGVDRYVDTIATHLQELVGAGVLSGSQARKLEETALACRPESFDTGLIHGDFSADNMVFDGSGRLFVVDNESLQSGALDYDLARCWARWPMSKTLRRAFIAGYGRHRSLEGLAAHDRFWAIVALSQSIAIHRRYDEPCPGALAALERIACGAGSDLWPQL